MKKRGYIVDKKLWDTEALIRCENKECRQLSTEAELEKNKWKCPHCGNTVNKP